LLSGQAKDTLDAARIANANLDVSLAINPLDYQDDLEQSIKVLTRFGINSRIYNLQFCVLRSSLWKYSKQAISDWKNTYLEVCGDCAVRERCGGFFHWETKLHSRGVHALQPEDPVLNQPV
jgi:hypothetical protein